MIEKKLDKYFQQGFHYHRHDYSQPHQTHEITITLMSAPPPHYHTLNLSGVVTILISNNFIIGTATITLTSTVITISTITTNISQK